MTHQTKSDAIAQKILRAQKNNLSLAEYISKKIIHRIRNMRIEGGIRTNKQPKKKGQYT